MNDQIQVEAPDVNSLVGALRMVVEPSAAVSVVGDRSSDLVHELVAAGYEAADAGDADDGARSAMLVSLAGDEHPSWLADLTAQAGGTVMLTVESRTHGSRRLAALAGDRCGSGLARDELIELAAAAGLRLVRLWATVVEPEDPTAVVPSAVVDWVRRQPGAYESAYVALVEPGEQVGPAPLTELLDRSGVETSALTSASVLDADDLVEECRRLRRTVMSQRDHHVGTRVEFARALHERDVLRKEAGELRHVVHELRTSVSWRLGQMLVSPAAAVVRALRRRAG